MELAGRYDLEREIGAGGMATVYLARDVRHDRRVALKVLKPDLGALLGVQRFLAEIKVTANLQHPNLLPLFDSGEAAGCLYYVMPYVEGESLRALLTRAGAVPLAAAVPMLGELSDALAYAHARGVVHRDLKPENVLVRDGHALLADFGVAKAIGNATGAGKLTTAGIVLGTPAYMAPEQVAADPAIDHRADIYSFGLLAYEMLSGETPYGPRSPQALLAAHLTEPPRRLDSTRPGLPAVLSQLVMHCLEKDPARRPQSAAEITSALRALGVSTTSLPVTARAVSGRRAALAAAAVAVVAALGFVAWRAWGTAAEGGAIESIAVLPFVNVGGDSAEEYFADGMTDETIAALAKVSGLRVASRTSAFTFKNRPVDVRVVGEKLHVRAVLEATVHRDGTRLRLNAQLSSVRDGLTLWSENFEHERTDVFGVQDALARAIVSALRPSLRGQPAEPVATRGTTDLAAYDLYLKGRFFLEKRSLDGLTEAARQFGDATARDPGYALAWAGLADAWALLGTFEFVDPRVAFPKARVAATRALQLDSTLAEPNVSLGLIDMFFEWRWADAEREFQHAIALNPDYGSAYLFRGWLFAITARLDEALASLRRAREVEPLSLIINVRVGSMLFFLGRYAEAERELRTTLALDSAFPQTRLQLADVLTLQGRSAEALRLLQSAGADLSRFDGAKGYAFGVAGRRTEARAFLVSIERARKSGIIPSDALARDALTLTYLGLGDRDAAFAQLALAVSDRAFGPIAVGIDPRYRSLWGDPRMAEIRRATNLAGVPPAWTRTATLR